LLQPAAIPEIQKRIALYEDMKAYKELYYMLFDQLHRFSYSFVKSNEAAEEIVSDVFIKIWEIRARLTEIENLKVYIYTITKNFSINYIHRNYKNVPLSIDEIDIEPQLNVANPEELFISAEILERVREGIRQLPPQCRIIFQLIKEDGLKYREVASILHISPLTVRNQLAIAVRKIAASFPGQSQKTNVLRTLPSN
jgi:RNA polymerase sigma-70 factor (family 1)